MRRNCSNKSSSRSLALSLFFAFAIIGIVTYATWQRSFTYDTRSKAYGGQEGTTTIVGTLDQQYTDNSFREFGSTNNTAVYTFGAGSLQDVRRWIGHSDCSTCTPGIPKRQQFVIKNVDPQTEYMITVYPGKFPRLTNPVTFQATITAGNATIVSGREKTYSIANSGFTIPDGTWTFTITSTSPTFTVEIGNNHTSGNFYMYVDGYTLLQREINVYDQVLKSYSSYVLSKNEVFYIDYYKKMQKKPNDMGGIGLGCSTLLAAYKKTKDNALLVRAKRIGDYLVTNNDLNRDGKVGWGFDATADPFQDGTINPTRTEYMFQTARAINCLAELYEETGIQSYITIAKQAITDSWNMGTSEISGCKNCFFYWYSYHPNDKNRYVRNTNLQMAQALSYVYHATKKGEYRTRAFQIVNEERFEISKNNQGYFGVSDNEYSDNESKRTNNHYPLLALYMYDIARLQDVGKFNEYTVKYMNDWKNCTSSFCADNNCDLWAGNINSCTNTQTFYYCYVRNLSAEFDDNCKHEIAEGNTNNLMYAWSILRGFPDL